ncbi:hypothetical protein ACFV6E_03155 [Streptomyces sp. NPDC059785]|uniref:hypothetical protein n=1 Tax=Streptomyces sp. NPDC059785 TaxID=3346945 RepID=UPI00365380BD
MKKSGVGRGSLVVGRRSVVVGFAVSAGGAAAGGCTPGTRAAVGGERTTGSASPRPLFFAPDDYREETRKTDRATFTWEDFLTHVGARKKSIPAFDAFDLSTGENNEFGKDRVKARHFTPYSLRHTTTGSGTRRLDGDIPEKLRLMNPMHFIERKNPGRAKHWWIRLGTKDSDTSLTVSCNLAAAAAAAGADVDHRMHWDEGHGANTDAADFITWAARVTGRRT